MMAAVTSSSSELPDSQAINWQAVATVEMHPVRRKVLNVAARDPEVSPVALSRELDEPIGNVSYHVRELVRRGVLREVRREQRRGAIQHWYELVEGFRA